LKNCKNKIKKADFYSSAVAIPDIELQPVVIPCLTEVIQAKPTKDIPP